MFNKEQKIMTNIKIAKIFGVNHCIVANIIKQFQECENIKMASQMDKPKNKFKARSSNWKIL